MLQFLQLFFGEGFFIPHGHCYLWKPGLMWLHILSDSLIAIAYYSIPITLVYFVQKRRDLPFDWVFLLFGGFIIFCGTTHGIEIWTLWHPTYWVAGVVKAFTAGISVSTAIVLVPIIPKALALPSPAQLEAVNRELENIRQKLEVRVEQRTAELQEAIAQLEHEIEERNEIEIALQESQNWLSAMAEANPHIFYIYDLIEQRNVYTNQAIFTILGYTPAEVEEMEGTLLPKLIHPDDLTAVSKDLGRFDTALDGDIIENEYRMRHKNGEWCWFSCRETIFTRTSTGQPLQIIGTETDITERKQIEAALIKSEKKYRDLVEASQDLIWSVNAQGNYTFVNGAVKQIYGYEPEEVIGHPFTNFIAPQQLIEDVDLFNRMLKGASVFHYETTHLAKDDRPIHLILNAIPQLDESEQFIGIIGTATDITERKQREEALQLILEGTASATGNSFMRDCVRYLAEVLHVRYAFISEVIDSTCSRARTLAFWMGTTWSENFEYDIADTPCEHVLNGETCFYPQDLQALFPNLPSLVELSAQSYFGTPLVQSDGNIVGLLVVLDVKPMAGDLGKESILKIFAARAAVELERQKAENALRESEAREREKAQTLEATIEELKRTQSQLIQAEKMSSMGRIVAGICHEINNPLNFISGNLTYANQYFQYLFSVIKIYQDNQQNFNSNIREIIDDSELAFIREDWLKILCSMEVGTIRIQEIMNSLRNFSRLDESDLKTVDIHTGIENTLLILQHRLKGAGNQPSIEVIKDYGKLPLFTCYASQLNQVFLNLLNNAIDALENKPAPRGIWISTSVENEDFGVRSSEWGVEADEIVNIDSPLNSTQSIIIRITDNGYGMSEDVQHKIFDPFFTTKPVGSGTGLGLSISYQIVVNRHGGEMRCHSLKDGGTEFTIMLPIFPGKWNS